VPKVTVITPNYNHARYLSERIDSILAQTFQDFELLILDDASTDNSREIIESYCKNQRARAIFNQQNSGSTFGQWNLGLSQAKGEYVWFAESDDYADPALLETLVDRLDRHPNVGLAVCQSWSVDQDSKLLGNYRDRQEHLNHSSHWGNDYVNAGRDECKSYLFWQNTIPNASAVLFRRSTLILAGGVPDGMLLNGDWMTYVKVLLISDIAFVSSPLNFFRQHSGTVRSRLSNGNVPTLEMLMVQRHLLDRCGLPDGLRDDRETLTNYVNVWIEIERRPPYNKVPFLKSLGLLFWFARIHPRALKLALPTLARELMAGVARRTGLLVTGRKVKNTLARSTQKRRASQIRNKRGRS
jgi:glycosyltransferase involved in cell wall biosynthesis